MDWIDGPFVGMEPGPDGEGAKLLYRRPRSAHYAKPEYVYAHEWDKGDLVIYDDRTLIHAAMAATRSSINGRGVARRSRRSGGAEYAGEAKSWVVISVTGSHGSALEKSTIRLERRRGRTRGYGCRPRRKSRPRTPHDAAPVSMQTKAALPACSPGASGVISRSRSQSSRRARRRARVCAWDWIASMPKLSRYGATRGASRHRDARHCRTRRAGRLGFGVGADVRQRRPSRRRTAGSPAAALGSAKTPS